MTTSATKKLDPITFIAFDRKVRQQARRIRQLCDALTEARDDLAVAIETIEDLREQLAASEGINAQHEEVLRRLLHEREVALQRRWEA